MPSFYFLVTNMEDDVKQNKEDIEYTRNFILHQDARITEFDFQISDDDGCKNCVIDFKITGDLSYCGTFSEGSYFSGEFNGGEVVKVTGDGLNDDYDNGRSCNLANVGNPLGIGWQLEIHYTNTYEYEGTGETVTLTNAAIKFDVDSENNSSLICKVDSMFDHRDRKIIEDCTFNIE